MSDRSVVNVTASSLKNANGNSGSVLVPSASQQLTIEVLVTALTGVGATMALTVQWSDDGVNFADADPVDAFTNITAVGNKAKNFAVKGQFFQLVWVLTGTSPTFTFSAIAYGV